MLKHFFIIALLIAALAGCKSKSAFNYSETIVKKERSLGPDIQSTEAKAKIFLEAGNYDSLGIAGATMERKIQEKIDEIDALPLPDAKGAADFKSAAIGYFRYIKSLYVEYKNFGNAQTAEQRALVIKDLQDLVAEKPAILSNMRKAQEKYAKDNGFRTE